MWACCRVNVYEGPLEERMMQTGSYIVADILCNCCQQVVGWKYVSVHLLFVFTILGCDVSIQTKSKEAI